MEYRSRLEARDGERFRVRAQVERFGSKRGFRGHPEETVLLKDVRDAQTNERLTDHLWFTRGATWSKVRAGDSIEFDARVDAYIKGYFGNRMDVFCEPSIDYKLSRPTKLTVVERAQSA